MNWILLGLHRWGSSNPVPAVGHFNLASSCYGHSTLLSAVAPFETAHFQWEIARFPMVGGFTGGTCTFQGCDSYRMAQCNSGKCVGAVDMAGFYVENRVATIDFQCFGGLF